MPLSRTVEIIEYIKIQNDDRDVLRLLMLPKTKYRYNPRSRRHDYWSRKLVLWTPIIFSYELYKHSYWHYLVPVFSNSEQPPPSLMRTCHYWINEYCIVLYCIIRNHHGPALVISPTTRAGRDGREGARWGGETERPTGPASWRPTQCSLDWQLLRAVYMTVTLLVDESQSPLNFAKAGGGGLTLAVVTCEIKLFQNYFRGLLQLMNIFQSVSPSLKLFWNNFRRG